MRRTTGTCVYCGASATTMDHVPPRGLFAKPFPNDLLTVPSCLPCNQNAKLDDEYFRTLLSFRFETGGHSDARAASERAMRRLASPGAQGFRKGLASKVSEIALVDDDGARLGSIGLIDADRRRFAKVVERIVRGLYFHRSNERLPADYSLVVNSEESFEDPDAAAIERLRVLSAWAMEAERHVLSRSVLEYRVRETPHEPASAVWLLTFYETVTFVVVVRRQTRA